MITAKIPDATDGIFAAGSYAKNIHVVFGMTAQVKAHQMMIVPEEYYDDLDLWWENKFFEGPSIGAVKDTADGHFHIDIQNVTMEGFKHDVDKPIRTRADSRPGQWGDALRKWKADRGMAV